MRCFEMQDWVTIRGASSASQATTIQSEHQWLDLAKYSDVVLWTEIKEATLGSGTVDISFETAPSKDESLFSQAVAPFLATAGTVTASVVHRDTATVPLGRWLRWKITSGAGTAWDVVFRVWVAAAGGGGGDRGAASGG